jgi:MFS transporter, SHS family, sialic acid transporter
VQIADDIGGEIGEKIARMTMKAADAQAGAQPGMAISRADGTPIAASGPTRGQWMVLLAAFLGWLFDGFEMGLFPVIARPALRSMLVGQGEAAVGHWMGTITALFLVGAAAGGAVFGWLGDRIGRVRALSLSILAYSLFTAAGYLATEPWHLGFFRAIAALGMGGEWALGVALVMEAWPERHRPWLASAIGAAANLGYLLVAVVAAVLPVTVDSWRWMMLLGAAPALLVFFIRLFVPESERWQQAVALEPARPLREIFSPALRRRTAIGIALASVVLIGTWASVQWIPLWIDRVTEGTMPRAKAVAQTLSAGGAVVGSFLAPLLAARIGRRGTYFALCLASFAACAVLFRVLPERYGPAILFNIFLVGVSTAAFYGWFPLYLPELFPTRARATGQGVCYNAGRLLAAGGALLQSQLVAHFQGSYARAAATITLVYLVGALVVWLAPETDRLPA